MPVFRNLRFACALTFVVARSAFREWNNFSGLKEARPARLPGICRMFDRSTNSLFCWHLHSQVILSLVSFWKFFSPLATCHARHFDAFCIFCFIRIYSDFSPDVFGRLYVRATRGACCMTNCFLEGQFVSDVFLFFRRKLPNCPELLPCVSLTFVAPKVRTSSKLPPVDVFFVLRIDLLEEEKGAEAFFSLSITSYSYVYCVQTAGQAMTQWCSILLAAYGIAEFLVQKMEPFLPEVQFLLVFQCFSCCRTVLNSTRQH